MATICILCDLHCCPYPSLFPGDVAGSVEVLESLLNKHQPHEFQFKIISSGVGNVTEADIELAHGTGGRHCELRHMKAFTVGTTVEQLHLVHLPLQHGPWARWILLSLKLSKCFVICSCFLQKSTQCNSKQNCTKFVQVQVSESLIGQQLFKIKFYPVASARVLLVFPVKEFNLQRALHDRCRDQRCSLLHSIILVLYLAGMVLGFNVVLPKSYEIFARHREVEVLTNRVIYRLLQQLKVGCWWHVCVCV